MLALHVAVVAFVLRVGVRVLGLAASRVARHKLLVVLGRLGHVERVGLGCRLLGRDRRWRRCRVHPDHYARVHAADREKLQIVDCPTHQGHVRAVAVVSLEFGELILCFRVVKLVG